jgi:hypothetical protein
MVAEIITERRAASLRRQYTLVEKENLKDV